MATLTTAYLDRKFTEQDTKFQERLENTANAIMGVMKLGFDEQSRRIDKIEASLASLTNSVDRFVKMITDQGQELMVLRQQLRDAENRIKQLELHGRSS